MQNFPDELAGLSCCNLWWREWWFWRRQPAVHGILSIDGPATEAFLGESDYFVLTPKVEILD
jgi:hypothetical protein